MELPRPEHRVAIPFSRGIFPVGCHSLLQGNLSDPGIKPRSPALKAESLPSELLEKPVIAKDGKSQICSVDPGSLQSRELTMHVESQQSLSCASEV